MTGPVEAYDTYLIKLRDAYRALEKERDELQRDVKRLTDQLGDALDEVHARGDRILELERELERDFNGEE